MAEFAQRFAQDFSYFFSPAIDAADKNLDFAHGFFSSLSIQWIDSR
jgi:hypothetical protein